MPVAMRASLLVLALAFLHGCSDNPRPVNPSFPVTFGDASRAREAMALNRTRLARPLVIVGGYLDLLDTHASFARDYFRGVIDDDRVLIVGVNDGGSFRDVRRALIDAVDRAFPCGDPSFTTEVDVVGQSLGGLVARYAAAPSDDPAHPRRLRVARLFTVGSPHRGANAAGALGVTSFQRDLAPGSAFIEYVAAHDAAAEYELYPYALLGDWFVGPENAAPPGASPFWLASESVFAHPASQSDARIFADIALRLRGEAAFSRAPGAPLPQER